MHDDVLPDKKIQEIIYAARPELRLGSRRWSVVDVDASRGSITFRVVEDDVDVGHGVRGESESFHTVRWAGSVSQQAARSEV